MHDSHQKPKIIVIVGPTASGKTSLSIEIAKRVDGEVISADSRQVYRGLDIGTGKVTKEEMDGIAHHLLDVTEPTKVYTAMDFKRDSEKAIADINARGKVPIIAGGTFLYIDVLLGRIHAPEVPPNPELRKRLESMSKESLYTLLKEKDPRRAEHIDSDNPRRLVRALEIVETLGHVPEERTTEPYDVLTIGIDISKETLHANIATRLQQRLNEGMIDEIRQLNENGLSWERLESLGLEYRYIARYLQGLCPKKEMLTKLETEIRHFAKRQMTWLKRDTTIHWFKKDTMKEINTCVDQFIN